MRIISKLKVRYLFINVSVCLIIATGKVMSPVMS